MNKGEYEICLVHMNGDVNATNNWWGTTNTDSIDARIYDYYDDSTQGEVLYTPFLTAPINGPPYIKSITDIPNDQGRQVTVSWYASEYDAPEDTVTITEYCLWRRIDSLSVSLSGRETKEEDVPSLKSFPPGDWHYILTVPACGQEVYNCVAPTLCDLTSDDTCWSVFFVSAMTPEPLILFCLRN